MIIGNPALLGGKRLGDEYVDDLFRLYEGRVPREADLVIYWFEGHREPSPKALRNAQGYSRPRPFGTEQTYRS
jgi:hypothetical protein